MQVSNGSGCVPEYGDAGVGTSFAIVTVVAIVTFLTLVAVLTLFASCGAGTRSFFRDCGNDIAGGRTRDLSGPALEEFLNGKLRS